MQFRCQLNACLIAKLHSTKCRASLNAAQNAISHSRCHKRNAFRCAGATITPGRRPSAPQSTDPYLLRLFTLKFTHILLSLDHGLRLLEQRLVPLLQAESLEKCAPLKPSQVAFDTRIQSVDTHGEGEGEGAVGEGEGEGEGEGKSD